MKIMIDSKQNSKTFNLYFISMSLPQILLLRMKQETIEQIQKKGEKVNISFYFFYDNSIHYNNEVIQVAIWWIQKNNLPHFVQARSILTLIETELKNF